MEEKRHSGFWNFQRFCAGFSSSSWIYLPLILRLMTFGWGFCVVIFFVDVVAFCLLVFLRTVRLPFCMSAAVCWRSTADPVKLGIKSGGCRTAKIAACSFLWKLHLRGGLA